MRIAIKEVLQEITTPKCIYNIECLKMISDILRFVLTLFVHEESINYELLITILDAS